MNRSQTKMSITIALWTAFFALVWAAYGQEKPAAKEFKPSEVQSLKLQVKQKDALLAKAAMESAQQQFQQAVVNLTSLGEAIKKENKWDEKVAFDPNLLTFTEPPAPKKEDKKEKEPPKP